MIIVTPSVIIVKHNTGAYTSCVPAKIASPPPLFIHSNYGTIDITMTIAPIKTARDYERALHRIERLMDSKPDTKMEMNWTC